jgi:hypothetical protein
MTTTPEMYGIPPCPFPETDLKDNEVIIGVPLYGRRTRYDLFTMGGTRRIPGSDERDPPAVCHRVTLRHEGWLSAPVTVQLRLIQLGTGKIVHQADWELKSGCFKYQQFVHTIELSLITRHLYQLHFRFEDVSQIADHYLHALLATDF